MADITQPEGIPPVPGASLDAGRDRQAPAGGHREPAHPPPTRAAVRDVASVLGLPMAELTPKVEEALATLMAEADRIRRELAVAREQIAHLERLADQDPVLPVLNRRALARELGRVLARLQQAPVGGALVTVALANLADIRGRAGRRAGDAAMAVAAARVVQGVPAGDPVGLLWDGCLGVILAGEGLRAAHDTAEALKAAVAAEPAPWRDEPFALDVRVRVHTLKAGESAESAIAAAAPIA